MSAALELAGQRAVTEASRLWQLDVIDPPRGSTHPRAADSLRVIDEIIKASGWGFALPTGKYEGNGPPQWCGMTAGWCWRAAGLDPRWLQVWWASTMRLIAWARYKPWNAHINPRPTRTTDADDQRRCVELARGKPVTIDLRAGDVVIVGDGRDVSGQHVTICVAYDAPARTIDTISGNGGGAGPHGDRREGISRRTYAIDAATGYRAMWAIRPAFGDLLAERD